jgi:hypothetical protein
MKRRLAKASFALAATLLLAVAPVGATTSVTMDGVWWQGISSNAKVVAVQGILTGIDSGYTSGWFGGDLYIFSTYMTPQQRASITNARVTKSLAEEDALRAAAPTFSKTFGTYVDEIVVWYEVHPKSTSIGPAQLLEECYADKPPLTASDCDALGNAAAK